MFGCYVCIFSNKVAMSAGTLVYCHYLLSVIPCRLNFPVSCLPRHAQVTAAEHVGSRAYGGYATRWGELQLHVRSLGLHFLGLPGDEPPG